MRTCSTQRLSGEFWVVGRDQAEAQSRAEAKFPGQKFVLEQDEDVLDTWFSSGLWPFSIQGWPTEVSALQAFAFCRSVADMHLRIRITTSSTSTPPTFSRQAGIFSSSGSRAWFSSAFTSQAKCPSPKSSATP